MTGYSRIDGPSSGATAEAGVKGDRVEIVVDVGGGATKTYDVVATRAGRRVEVVNRRGLIEVTEITRGGATIRTARFLPSRVVALVEHPAPRRAPIQSSGGSPARDVRTR